MQSLRELREYVLDRPDEGVTMLEIADGYLQMYDKLGSQLVLPKEQAFAKPVVECFADDPAAYARWLKKLRDTLEQKTTARKLLSALFRKVEIRGIQRERRARENAAVITAVKLGKIKNTPADKSRYLRRLALEWGARRYALLDDARKKVHSGRLTLDEQDSLLEAFWQEVEDEISRGELPEP